MVTAQRTNSNGRSGRFSNFAASISRVRIRRLTCTGSRSVVAGELTANGAPTTIARADRDKRSATLPSIGQKSIRERLRNHGTLKPFGVLEEQYFCERAVYAPEVSSAKRLEPHSGILLGSGGEA